MRSPWGHPDLTRPRPRDFHPCRRGRPLSDPAAAARPSSMTTRPRLFISRDADADWITAIEVGHIDDGVPAERWEPLNCWVAWLLDHDGRKIGVRLQDASEADLRDDVFAELWDLDGPRFDAPTLGLTDIPIAAALTAALPVFGEHSSLNRFYFGLAIDAQDDPPRPSPSENSASRHVGLTLRAAILVTFFWAWPEPGRGPNPK